MATMHKLTKGETVEFKKCYIPSRQSRYRSYIEMSVSLRTGILIGKTVCYEGRIKVGSYEEPSEFIPEKSIVFWVVEPNNTARYRKPYLVKEEDLIHAQID